MVNDQLPTIKNSFVNLRKRKYKLRYVCNEHVWSCIIDCQSISYGNLFLPSPRRLDGVWAIYRLGEQSKGIGLWVDDRRLNEVYWVRTAMFVR